MCKVVSGKRKLWAIPQSQKIESIYKTLKYLNYRLAAKKYLKAYILTNHLIVFSVTRKFLKTIFI